jgi:quercetin dioxygenase-like cupin family protein
VKLTLVILALAVSASGDPQPDLDAVVAAPGNHRVLLENEQVRVLQVEVAPGETEPVHEHRWPSVLHIQSAQPAIDISYAMRDGRMVETGRRDLPAGTPPPALWVPRQEAHAVKNLGSAPFRLLRVELKQPAVDER